MTPSRGGRRPIPVAVTALALVPAIVLAVALVLATLVLAVALAACGGPAPTPGVLATSSLVPAESGLPDAVGSPVTGRLTLIDAESLTRVRGFRLRLDNGSEVAFTIGRLENGGEFPPGHLAEHMSSSSAVKVFFRDEGGELVVYRIEDGE